MFDFLLSEEKKMRQHAKNWLEVAERVVNFRRDLLSVAQNQQLAAATGEVRTKLKEKADASKLKLSIEKLEVVLRDTGGRYYPMSSLMENVEFFLVAALVILGLRAYFVQPFKIPTNSMWPSYYGMTHELFADGQEPGLVKRAARLAAFGATNYRVEATADGEVYVPAVAISQTHLRYLGSEANGRFLGVLPSANKEWEFGVNGDAATTKVSVPADFNFEHLLEERLSLPHGGLSDFLEEQARKLFRSDRQPESSVTSYVYDGQRRDLRVYWIPIGLKVKRGQPILSFDILTGDLLFVDRISYNFFQPKIGQGFVFKTENIHSPYMERAGNQIRQYYVKRLVGLPGDTLEVKEPTLWRNGAPIQGASAFNDNANRRGQFTGYTNVLLLDKGQSVKVPEHSYFAMGDNSRDSADSRYWGFVPEMDVVGTPLFIYYPLSTRWGVAH